MDVIVETVVYTYNSTIKVILKHTFQYLKPNNPICMNIRKYKGTNKNYTRKIPYFIHAP